MTMGWPCTCGDRSYSAAHIRPRAVARPPRRARRPGGQGPHDRGQPAARRAPRQALPARGLRDDADGPDPGGHDRARARGREVRLPARAPVLDVRDAVDPPGRRPRARRQGPDRAAAGDGRRPRAEARDRRARAHHAARLRSHAGRAGSRPRLGDRGHRGLRGAGRARLHSMRRSPTTARPSSATSSPRSPPRRRRWRSRAPNARESPRRWASSGGSSGACSSCASASAARRRTRRARRRARSASSRTRCARSRTGRCARSARSPPRGACSKPRSTPHCQGRAHFPLERRDAG